MEQEAAAAPPPKPLPIDQKIVAMAMEEGLTEGLYQYRGGRLMLVTDETREHPSPERIVIWQIRVPPGGMIDPAAERAEN